MENQQDIFFKPSHNVLDGYYIPVRNNWNYKIMKRHITKREKELYERQFGKEILTDDEYFKWWKKIHHIN